MRFKLVPLSICEAVNKRQSRLTKHKTSMATHQRFLCGGDGDFIINGFAELVPHHTRFPDLLPVFFKHTRVDVGPASALLVGTTGWRRSGLFHLRVLMFVLFITGVVVHHSQLLAKNSASSPKEFHFILILTGMLGFQVSHNFC